LAGLHAVWRMPLTMQALRPKYQIR